MMKKYLAPIIVVAAIAGLLVYLVASGWHSDEPFPVG